MARNRVQNGRRITADPGGPVSSGDVIGFGDMVVVAMTDGDAGTPIEWAVSEVYRIPKASGTTFAAGTKVSWDASAGQCAETITPAAGDVQNFGVAWEAAVNGQTEVAVLLTPGTGTGS